MGRNKNNRRRKQGQKKAAEQQQHSRNVSSASSSTAPPSTPVTTTGFSRDPQEHSGGGSDEEEEDEENKGGEEEEEVAGVEGRKDGGHKTIEMNKEKSIEDELLNAAMGPTTLPPIPFRRVPVTPQRQVVGGLWSAAFVALMIQALLEPESDVEWREQMRGPAFSLATLGLCMSVIYMRGLEIQFSQFFKAWTRTPMERYG
ncbi:hypothetical protein PGQ11_009312 [Apiospora arundinis]|uniref:Uncharacterized protein n=1 Tax=Apiospora arundinis TaxID=335852 RepID=A0ABR2IHN4_9PEZI